MGLVKKVVPCKTCSGTGDEVYDGIAVDCKECLGKGEVIKSEYVVRVSQQARDKTREWMKKNVTKNKGHFAEWP